MDMETYNQREEDFAAAERLLAAERDRLAGLCGYSAEEFKQNMQAVIAKGSVLCGSKAIERSE